MFLYSHFSVFDWWGVRVHMAGAYWLDKNDVKNEEGNSTCSTILASWLLQDRLCWYFPLRPQDCISPIAMARCDFSPATARLYSPPATARLYSPPATARLYLFPCDRKTRFLPLRQQDCISLLRPHRVSVSSCARKFPPE